MLSAFRDLLTFSLVFGLSWQAFAEGAAAEKSKEHGNAAAAAAPPVIDRSKYIHNWVAMPSFTAPQLPHLGEQVTVAQRNGRVLVLVFLASWCEPCQELISAIRSIEQRYENLNTDFVYVFAHDTPQDAEGFMKEFKMPTGVLGSYDALKAYHNPPLPSIYVGDRRGWLAARFLATRAEDLEKLTHYLRYWTAY